MNSPTKPGVAARLAAVIVVNRVVRTGAYSNIVTSTETGHLEEDERRHAVHLSYGTLRQLPRVDRVIRGFSRRSRIEPQVEDALRVGVFELLFSSAPAHAVVDSTVATIRQLGLGRASGFANGLLRSVDRGGEPQLPLGVEGRALLGGVPQWLVEMLDHQWGAAETDSFLASSLEEPRLGVRQRPPRSHPVPDDLEPVEGIDGAFHARTLPAGWIIQDPASVAVGLAAAPTSTESVLDMAAAPGGKTLHLADQLPGVLVAADRNGRRVQRGQRRMMRDGVNVPWVIADGRRPPFPSASFDVVVLDAPCSGLGTLRRRPEIKLKVTPQEVARLAALQRALLGAALELVRPDGRVVYSVCTVTAAETVDVVADYPSTPPEGLPGAPRGNGLLLAPHLTGTDGMFISIVRPG